MLSGGGVLLISYIPEGSSSRDGGGPFGVVLVVLTLFGVLLVLLISVGCVDWSADEAGLEESLFNRSLDRVRRSDLALPDRAPLDAGDVSRAFCALRRGESCR